MITDEQHEEIIKQWSLRYQKLEEKYEELLTKTEGGEKKDAKTIIYFDPWFNGVCSSLFNARSKE